MTDHAEKPRLAHRVVLPLVGILQVEAATPEDACRLAAMMLGRQEDGNLVEVPFRGGILQVNVHSPAVLETSVIPRGPNGDVGVGHGSPGRAAAEAYRGSMRSWRNWFRRKRS